MTMNVPGQSTSQEVKAPTTTGELAPIRKPPAHDSSILDAILTETEKYRNALEPTTGEEAWLEAQRIHKSGMCGVQSVEDAYIRIKTGRSLGMGSMAAVQSIDVIESRPSLKAKTKVALCQSRTDKIAYFRIISTTDEESTWEAKRVNDPPFRHTYTIAMAQKAGLTDRGKTEEAKKSNNWTKHPAAMLRARASGQLADIIANDVLMGFPTSEEMEDVRNERLEAEGLPIHPKHAAPVAPQAAPTRDFASEAALIVHEMGQCTTLDGLKAMMDKITGFVEEAPKEHAYTIRNAYRKAQSQLKTG